MCAGRCMSRRVCRNGRRRKGHPVSRCGGRRDCRNDSRCDCRSDSRGITREVCRVGCQEEDHSPPQGPGGGPQNSSTESKPLVISGLAGMLRSGVQFSLIPVKGVRDGVPGHIAVSFCHVYPIGQFEIALAVLFLDFCLPCPSVLYPPRTLSTRSVLPQCSSVFICGSLAPIIRGYAGQHRVAPSRSSA